MFKITDIEYNKITYYMTRVEHVEWNNTIGRNIINEDDIENFVSF